VGVWVPGRSGHFSDPVSRVVLSELHGAKVDGAVGDVQQVWVRVEVGHGEGERLERSRDVQHAADAGRGFAAAYVGL